MIESDGILITTTDAIPGTEIELIGPVNAACCLSKSAVGDFLANVKNWSVGGELGVYAKLLESSSQNVYRSITAQCVKMDADAVVGFRFVTSSVASGAAELIGYGTAVRIRRRDSGTSERTSEARL
jgi:uncharacterized protein YbjQ (UPF0145 family)